MVSNILVSNVITKLHNQVVLLHMLSGSIVNRKVRFVYFFADKGQKNSRSNLGNSSLIFWECHLSIYLVFILLRDTFKKSAKLRGFVINWLTPYPPTPIWDKKFRTFQNSKQRERVEYY